MFLSYLVFSVNLLVHVGFMSCSEVGFACTGETVTLSCPNRTIDVISATYGRYATPCDTAFCCAASNADCSASVQDEAPLDWADLLVACQNETSCEFEVPTHDIMACLPPTTSEYLAVNYECANPDEAPIAFTAFSYNASYSDVGEVLSFDGTISNVGGGFDVASGIFTCPSYGLYFFHASLMSTATEPALVDLYHNNDYVITIWSTQQLARQSSLSAVVECFEGETVRLQTKAPVEMSTVGLESFKTTTFSGYRFGTACQQSGQSKRAFACVLNVATLSCPQNYRIQIQRAEYAQYSTPCASQCCDAGVGDCSESVEDTSPLDWQDLLDLCQGETFCQVEHVGRALGSCSDPYLSDYLTIDYACVTEVFEACPAPSFTAYAYSSVLTVDTAVPFDALLIDSRSTFDLETSRYTCPTPGMYAFQASLLTDATYSASPDVRVSRIASATTDIYTSMFSGINSIQGGGLVILPCSIGDEVYLFETQNAQWQGSETSRTTALSGFRIGDVTTPAFTVCVGTTTAYDRNTVIDFNVELTNQGDHYDNVLHVFYCPVDGLYMFHVSLLNGGADPFAFNLVKNNEVVVSVSGFNDQQVSNVVMLECNSDELVWVEAALAGSANGAANVYYSCFSGILLQ